MDTDALTTLYRILGVPALLVNAVS